VWVRGYKTNILFHSWTANATFCRWGEGECGWVDIEKHLGIKVFEKIKNNFLIRKLIFIFETNISQ
jgi:hypothetical protein